MMYRGVIKKPMGPLVGYLVLTVLLMGSSGRAQDSVQAESQNVVEVETVSPMEAAGLGNAVALAAKDVPPPVITDGPRVTIGEALEKAAQRNLSLQSARLEIEKARATLSKSWGMVLPILQAKVEYTHMDHADELDLGASFLPLLDMLGITVPPGTDLGDPMLLNPQDKLEGSVDLVVPLVRPESWLQIRAAKKGVDMAALSIEDAERQLLLGVAQAYFMVLTTQNLIDFHYGQLQTAREQMRIANARFNAGRAMRIDVIRAETDYEQAGQSLRSATLAFDNARDTLGSLIGVDGLPLPSDSPELALPAQSDDQLTQQALRTRMDVRLSDVSTELATAQRRAVQARFLPRLDMMWHGTYQFTDMPDMGSDDRSRWALLFSLSMPLYDHFRYAELDEQRAKIRQAQLHSEDVKQKTTLQVRTARRDYATALSAVITAEKQETLAREGLTLTESAYRNGAGTSLDVTQAHQTYTAAGLNLATARLKSQLALLAFLDAVGEDIPATVRQSKARRNNGENP